MPAISTLPLIPIRSRRGPVAAIVTVLVCLAPIPAMSQSVTAVAQGWNDPAVLELVDRARTRRLQPLHEANLAAYSARADGRILFFVEREDGGDPFPLRIDQVSLDLYWVAPDRGRQVVRAQRTEETFPLLRDFRYYLDRLSVIQNGFSDEILVGEGRDVRAVPHPLAPGTGAFYDYRAGTRLELRLPGIGEPVRVQEIQVRPRDEALPGFVGTVSLDLSTASIVRLDFTFTPASYVDPRNDWIAVTLEHALWEGAFWLPYRQTVRVRREIPEVDLPAGTVIQAELEVVDYDFGDPPPEELPGAAGVAVEFPADGVGDTTRFARSIEEELVASGLVARGASEIRSEAIDALRQSAASGLPTWRLGGGFSRSFLRADRADGLFTGIGLVRQLDNGWEALGRGGVAWGSDRFAGGVTLQRRRPSGPPTWTVELRWDEPRDLSPADGIPTPLASGAALLGIADWRDPFPTRGIGVSAALGRGGRTKLSATWERHRTREQAWLEGPLGGGRFRPLLPVEPGDRLAGEVDVRLDGLQAPLRWGLGMRLEVGTFDTRAYTRVSGSLELGTPGAASGLDAKLRIRGGVAAGALPTQLLYYIGGQGTLPGHPIRGYVGRAFALADLELSRPLDRRWVDLRLALVAGRTAGAVEPGLTPLGIASSRGWGGAVGGGVGLLGGAVRLMYYSGSRGDGEWALTLDPRLVGR